MHRFIYSKSTRTRKLMYHYNYKLLIQLYKVEKPLFALSLKINVYKISSYFRNLLLYADLYFYNLQLCKKVK